MAKVLAIETSATKGSVAVCSGNTVLAQMQLGDGLRHGRLLLPLVSEVLAQTGLTLKQLDYVACGIGPGSYTGTRVGVMTAKALAFGVGLKCIPVSSLAALALAVANIVGTEKKIIPAQDARRDEVYTAVYAMQDGWPVALRADVALAPEEAARLCADGDFVIAGSAAGKYPEVFGPLSERGVVLLKEPDAPGAGEVGLLALHLSQGIDAMALEPVYMRRDDAPCTFERFMN